MSLAPLRPARQPASWILAASFLAGAAAAQAPAPPAPAPTPAAAPAADLAQLEAEVRRHLDAARQQRGFPGLSAAFVLPDGRIGAVAVGSEDDAGALPLSVASRMLSGSIGKTYCAAIALQLVADGKLALDAEVAQVLGAQAWFPRVPNAKTVTLRHLLTHTSGIPDHVWKQAFQDRVLADPDHAPDPVACVGYILDDAPLGEPGAKWSYADTNFVLVGLMIEAKEQRPFAASLRARILEPLQLRDTLASDRRDLPGLANGHASGIAFHRGDTVADGRYFVNPAFEYCGGGVCSTARDLARWGRALFAGEVVPEALRKEQLQPVPADPRVCDGYGLGCFVMKTPLGTAYGHSGFMPGYQAMVAHYPDAGLTVALMWNTDAGRQVGSPRRAAETLAALLRDRLAAASK